MNIYQALKMTCRDATYLHEKKKEGKLTASEHIGLWLHLLVCKFCSLFVKQINTIEKAARQQPPAALPAAAKQRIQSAFNNLRESEG